MKGFTLFPNDDNPTEIRKLVHDDLSELQELCRQHADFENATWDVDDQRLSRWRSAFFGLNSKVDAWVAVGPQGLCGYATVTESFSTWSGSEFAHLDCLFVSPGFRGLGIGRRLMEQVIKFARSKCVGRVEWQTPEWNESAARFYESFGATWTRKRRFLLTIESEKK